MPQELPIGRHVLLRDRPVRGRNKIEDNWLPDLYQVTERIDPTGDVYTVEPLSGHGAAKIVNRAELLDMTATKLIPELRILNLIIFMKIDYNCKLTTLETRRVRGDQIEVFCDQIEVFKVTHGIEDLDSSMFFKYKTDNRTRGHSWAVAKERCKLDKKVCIFSTNDKWME